MNDKLLHFICFGAIAFLLSFIMQPNYVVAIILFLSFAKELIDHFFRNSNFDPVDIVANIWGMLTALIVYRCVFGVVYTPLNELFNLVLRVFWG